MNNAFDSKQGDGEEGGDQQQDPVLNNLSPMTNLKSPPHQEEDNESNKKQRRAIDMNEDNATESSNAGPVEICFGPGSVNSPLTADSTAHSKWKRPVLPGKDRAKRLTCRLCKRLTSLKCIQCDHSFCDDGSGAGSTLRFCWTKHKDQQVIQHLRVICPFVSQSVQNSNDPQVSDRPFFH